MKKIIALGIVLLLLSCIGYASYPQKTYVLQPGSTIRANELNQNEDDFFNAITDGTKDLTFRTVSCNTLVATTLNYRTTQTINKFIAFNEFGQVTNNVAQYVFEPSAGRGRLVVSGNDTIIAPLILPNNATITVITPSMDSFVYVTVNRSATNSATAVVVATANGTTAQTNIVYPTVDNANYNYYLVAQSTSTNRYIQYVKVTYTTSVLGMD